MQGKCPRKRAGATYSVCLFGFLTLLCFDAHAAKPRAEKIFLNARVLTMDEKVPLVESFAVGRGKFLAIGTSREIKNAYPGSETIDLEGKTVMPGIIESHGHLLSLGEKYLQLDLQGIATPEQAVELVRRRTRETPTGEWIIGWGWDEGAWASAYPDNRALNEAAPRHPVLLRGLHGFASWVNARALETAGIKADTANPVNGEIAKDGKTGMPTGILTNAAQALVEKHVPPLKPQQVEKALQLAMKECLRNGLTSVHEAKTSGLMLAALQSLKKKRQLKTRVYAMLDAAEPGLIDSWMARGPNIDPDYMLTVRCIKVFVDGALGSRGAALTAPYSDEPSTKGLIVTDEEALYRLTMRSLKSGFQVAVHAIGDRANRIALSAFRRALAQVPGVKDHRLRIEHAQVVAAEDIPDFAPLGIVLSMQPSHCTSDMGWAEERLGPERIRGAYAWRSLLRTGVSMTLNSDFPGETLNPFQGMYAAETRQTPEAKPEGGWYPRQCLARQEVLHAYTVQAAYSVFWEKALGKIVPGMLADFIVLSADISKIPSRELLTLKVEKTYREGTLIFDSSHESSRREYPHKGH